MSNLTLQLLNAALSPGHVAPSPSGLGNASVCSVRYRLHLCLLRPATAELQGAKTYLRGVFPIQTSTQGGLATLLNTMYVFGLPKDYPETYREKIAAVTQEQVKKASETIFGSDNSVIAIVGDWSKVKDQLSSLNEITFVDVDGKPTPAPQ